MGGGLVLEKIVLQVVEVEEVAMVVKTVVGVGVGGECLKTFDMEG